ncbi:hypothetical protein GGTG_00991 [Gaeumannomyces tritici R3-111a-1]|uniref:Zn(2)-C6 fungal-type domain-containing protein n=1 Tax=Gaeumannomyces tritici (strain R3-111a-1) TaxID=644352 RepID=J3NIA8_GAET3|nr:hypothetical protein GGTG_00991 [Gaeumannomyces tritici R3-111a-1]EJT81001.1 hypothetical protein GGTG_00991 [Gaeumannomyces tritici R3-111a-1]
MGSGLPTPPREDVTKAYSVRKTAAVSKSAKAAQRSSKRGSIRVHLPVPSSHVSSLDPQSAAATSQSSADARHKRVWKACERCRMKKTKCDGEFPCKRCKDDGLVCTAGLRRKAEYKNIPRGYAEVLENTQFALVATIHKLYAMVRESRAWDLGEPELNDRGQAVIHDIASRLSCIRPNSDVDHVPVQAAFPEDEAGLADLIATLQTQQQQEQQQAAGSSRADRASSCEMDTSDLEHDYRKMAFGGGAANAPSSSAGAASPQSLYTDLDARPDSAASFSPHSPALGPGASGLSYEPWGSAGGGMPARPDISIADVVGVGAIDDFHDSFLQRADAQFMDEDLLRQGLLESEFGILKPHAPSCANPAAMMGLGDPMMFSGYDPETLRM